MASKNTFPASVEICSTSIFLREKLTLRDLRLILVRVLELLRVGSNACHAFISFARELLDPILRRSKK